jgi:hypothetical protein
MAPSTRPESRMNPLFRRLRASLRNLLGGGAYLVQYWFN